VEGCSEDHIQHVGKDYHHSKRGKYRTTWNLHLGIVRLCWVRSSMRETPPWSSPRSCSA
jgi:hypothetical protein